MYHAEYEDPDGQNGYYISAPTGKITHLSKNGVTRYLFENGNGERQEGTLEKLNESCRLKQLNFADALPAADAGSPTATPPPPSSTLTSLPSARRCICGCSTAARPF